MIVKFIKKVVSLILLFIVFILLSRFVLLPHIFPRRYQFYVEQYAEKYFLETSLVYAVIFTESRFQPNAISPKDAKGLMQITDKTGQWAADTIGFPYTQYSLYNPEVNIQIGCWYLNKLMIQFQEPIETALAAYNAGSGNVSKWLENPQYSEDGKQLKEIPFGETKRYVKKVLVIKKIYEMLYERES